MIIAKILAGVLLLVLSAGGIHLFGKLFDVPNWLLLIIAFAVSASLFVLVLK